MTGAKEAWVEEEAEESLTWVLFLFVDKFTLTLH